VTPPMLLAAEGAGSPQMLTRVVLEDGERPQRVAQLLQRVLVQHLVGLPRCGVEQVRARIEVQLRSRAHSMSGFRLGIMYGVKGDTDSGQLSVMSRVLTRPDSTDTSNMPGVWLYNEQLAHDQSRY